MSRSIALIVLMSACCLVATVQADVWYDEIYKDEDLEPIDVYNILMRNKMQPMADKYLKIYTDTSPDICSNEPYTKIYNGCIGGGNPSVSLQRYIGICEEKRKEVCKNEVQKAEELLFDDSFVPSLLIKYTSEDLFYKPLKILASNGDQKAQRFLELVKSEMKCEQLDDLRDLEKYRLRRYRRSKRLEYLQQNKLESYERDCEKYKIAMEEFRTNLRTLNGIFSETDLSNLENYRQKAFETYLKDVDQNDMFKINCAANFHRKRSHWLFGKLFISKIEIPTSCKVVVSILGNNNSPVQYIDGYAMTPAYISALREIPKEMRIEDHELSWIQTYWICRGLMGMTRL